MARQGDRGGTSRTPGKRPRKEGRRGESATMKTLEMDQAGKVQEGETANMRVWRESRPKGAAQRGPVQQR